MTGRIINIPFNQWSEARIEDGIKRATTRRKRYGFPGDWFYLNGKRYVFTAVKRATLETVKREFWKTEGCDNERHFEKIWVELHRRIGFVPSMRVWLHIFKEAENDG